MRNQGACSRIDAHIVAPLAAVPSGRAQVPELDEFLLLLVQRDVADRSGAEPVSNVPPGSLGLCYQSIYSSAGHSCVLPSSIALWPSGATVSRQRGSSLPVGSAALVTIQRCLVLPTYVSRSSPGRSSLASTKAYSPGLSGTSPGVSH